MNPVEIIPITCFGDCSGRAPFEGSSYVVAVLVGVLMPRWYLAFTMGFAVALAAVSTAIVSQFFWSDDFPLWLSRAYPVEQPWFWIERVNWLGLIVGLILAAHGVVRIVAYLRRRAPLSHVLASFGAALVVFVGLAAFSNAALSSLEAPLPRALSEDDWDLQRAAGAGRFDDVRTLLASSRKWPREVLTMTLAEVALAGAGDDLVRILLSRGADVNGRALAQLSILALAAQAGVPKPVASLLAAGADVKATDMWGETALHKTQFHPQFLNREIREPQGTDRGAIVDLLVRAGIPVDARDDWRHTPLIDNRAGHEAVARALIAHGADVNAQDSDGSTALMTNDNPKATEVLLAAGANPFLRDLDGLTVFDNRDKRGRLDYRNAIIATIERWIAANPQAAQRARVEAGAIGTSRIPKRHEPDVDPKDITPITHVGPGIGENIQALGFVLLVIVQLMIVFGLSLLFKIHAPEDTW